MHPGNVPRRLAGALLLSVLMIGLPLTTAMEPGTQAPALPVKVGDTSGKVLLSPADPRAPALAARSPGAAQGLYTGTVAPGGAQLHLVLDGGLALGLLEAPDGLVWVTVADGQLVELPATLATEGDHAGPVDEEVYAPGRDPAATQQASAASAVDGTVQLLVHGDFEYWLRTRATWDDHQLAVIHLVSAIFEHQLGVDLEVVDQTVDLSGAQPVTGDEICTGSSQDVLRQFRDHWEATDPTLSDERELAHLFTAKGFPGTTIGCAYISELETDWAYGVSTSLGTVGTTAGLRRDVLLVGHEIGHNFAGLHQRALPTPTGGLDAACQQPSSLMFPCVAYSLPVITDTRGPAEGAMAEEGVVQDGGNLAYMKSYATGRV